MTKKENILRTIKRKNPKWVPYRYDGSLTLLKPILITQPTEGGLDDWNVNWINTGTKEGAFPDEKPVISIDDIPSFKTPNTNWKYLVKDLALKINSLRKEDTLILSYNNFPLYDRARLLLGTTNFLTNLVLEKRKIEQLLDKITEYQEILTDYIMKSGVKGIRFCEDWGSQKAMIFSPEIWRSVIKPRLKKLYQIVKNYNGFVFQHSCGHIEEIIPDLIEIGLDLIDPCQPKSNDIFGWKKKYGDVLSFMGGIDTQSYLTFGSYDEVKINVKKVMSVMGNNGGYIVAPSHTVTVPEINRNAMIEAVAEFNLNR